MENFDWDFDEEEIDDNIDLDYCINDWNNNHEWKYKKLIKVNNREDFDKIKKIMKSKTLSYLYKMTTLFDFDWNNCIRDGKDVYLILNDNGQVQHINQVYKNEVIQLSFNGDIMKMDLIKKRED